MDRTMDFEDCRTSPLQLVDKVADTEGRGVGEHSFLTLLGRARGLTGRMVPVAPMFILFKYIYKCEMDIPSPLWYSLVCCHPLISH